MLGEPAVLLRALFVRAAAIYFSVDFFSSRPIPDCVRVKEEYSSRQLKRLKTNTVSADTVGVVSSPSPDLRSAELKWHGKDKEISISAAWTT
jgi:hypothetical protein